MAARRQQPHRVCAGWPGAGVGQRPCLARLNGVRGSTPPPSTPVPTPTSTGGDFDLTSYVWEAHCEAEDLREAFGEGYTLFGDASAIEWKPNGRGWWASVASSWINDNDEDKVVWCTSIVYDNASSAILDTNYHAIRLEMEGSFDILAESKIVDVPEIGNRVRALHLDRGLSVRGDDGWTHTTEALTTASLYARGGRAVIVGTIHYSDEDNPLSFPSTEDVFEVLQRIHARLSEESTSNVSRDLINVSTRGLQKTDASADVQGFLDIGR